MSDKSNREKERLAKAQGIPEPVRDRTATMTRAAYYRQFIGQRIYYQGVRMNYLGVVKDVIVDPFGDPTELLFDRLIYTCEWRSEGPNPDYMMEMPCDPVPAALTLPAGDQIGLAPLHWKW